MVISRFSQPVYIFIWLVSWYVYCIYTDACIYVYACVRVCVCVCVWTCVCERVRERQWVSVFVCLCVFACVCVRVYILYIRIYMYIDVYILHVRRYCICTRTQINTHICTHPKWWQGLFCKLNLHIHVNIYTCISLSRACDLSLLFLFCWLLQQI